MLARWASLRIWLLIALMGTAIIGVFVSVAVVERAHLPTDLTADRGKAESVAAAVAHQVAAGGDTAQLAAMQSVLPNDQLVVTRGGREVFAGPAINDRSLELTVTKVVGDIRVDLRDYESPAQAPLSELVLVAGLPTLLVVITAFAAASLISGRIQRPIERAIDAADRVAAGDFSARMGATGPDELVRLGRAFDGMASRLETADQNQRQFLADLAHEIATPVNSISGYGVALADGTVESAAEREEAATSIRSETQRLRLLLEDLRRLTQLDMAQAVRSEPVRLDVLSRDIADRFRGSARAKDVALTVHTEAVTLVSDRRLLETILVNLISNAIRYTPAGGRVDVKVRQRRRRAVIAVRDTGIGIPIEHQAKVFDRFYRVDQARGRKTGGTGLGLSIAQRSARSLGGRIELDSPSDAGSEFRLVLPASTTSIADSAEIEALQEHEVDGHRQSRG